MSDGSIVGGVSAVCKCMVLALAVLIGAAALCNTVTNDVVIATSDAELRISDRGLGLGLEVVGGGAAEVKLETRPGWRFRDGSTSVTLNKAAGKSVKSPNAVGEGQSAEGSAQVVIEDGEDDEDGDDEGSVDHVKPILSLTASAPKVVAYSVLDGGTNVSIELSATVTTKGCAANEDNQAKLAEIAAKVREIVEHREVPGGRSLSDVLCWFAKVEPQGESGLSMRLMKARTQDVKIYTGEHSWKKIGAGNTVSIHTCEKKCVWVEGISLDIGLDNAIFPVDGCPWLSNSVHTVYARMRESSEFHNTDKVDSYVISLDLKRAYYCEGKRDVDYPFPFTNPEPDMTQEEFEKSIEAEGQVEILEEMRNRLAKTFCPIVPYKRYSQRRVCSEEYVVVEFVVFEVNEDKLSCATFVPVQGADLASVSLMSLDFQKQQHVICILSADGEIKPFKVIKKTAYIGGQEEDFKRKFVKAMLKRLGLTAADLPGIDLSPILYAEH